MPARSPATPRAMERLPQYLAYLRVRRKQGQAFVSSTIIAEDLRLNPVQVRKDLALATNAGRPKTGYPIDTLIDDLESFLGYDNTQDAFVIGAGRLGSALLGNRQFADYGLNILAGFDTDPALHGREIEGKPIFPMEKLPNLVRRMRISIGILAVPPAEADTACAQMVESGIRAIWNFTVAQLKVPDDVIVHNENLATSFAILSKKLANRLEGGNTP